MNSRYQYSIIRFEPDRTRGECVNIGLAIFNPEGLDVRTDVSHSRQLFIREAGAFDELQHLSETMQYWAKHDSDNWEECYQSLAQIPRWSISRPGCFYANNENDYESEINALMKDLVLPSGSSRLAQNRKRLNTTLLEEFRRLNILGSSKDDLNDGLIIPRYTLDSGAKSLQIDFAANRKKLCLFQVVDLSLGDVSDKLKEVSYKALILDQAKVKFRDSIHTSFIFKGNDQHNNKNYLPHFEFMRNYSSSLIDYSDEHQKIKFLNTVINSESSNADMFTDESLIA